MLRWCSFFMGMLLCAPAAGGNGMRVEVAVIVPPLQRLEVSPAVSSLPAVSPLTLSAGFMEPGAPVRLTIFSNSPWELSIRRAAVHPEDDHPTIARILWKSIDGEYSDLPEDWTMVAAGSSAASGLVVPLHLLFLLDWRNARPGLYEPRIEYRLVPAGG